MKNFCKKLLIFLGIIAAISTSTSLISSRSTFADTRSDGSNCTNFLGMTNWDCGFNSSMSSEGELTSNIVIIASNVLTDITVIASYLVIGYVIYGGYLYMFSSGDAGKAASGKKSLTNAFIGLAIVMSAYAIFSGIRIAILGNKSFGDCNPLSGQECINAGDMVVNLIQWFGGVAGVVAAIFLVIGGWGYITSSGDSGKLQKAKTTIMYALIGLVIVALAEVLTAFIANLVRESNTFNGYLKDSTTQTIATKKEIKS